MQKELVAATVTAALLAGAGPGVGQDEPGAWATGSDPFDTLDTNRDASIDRFEAQVDRALSAAWDSADREASGTIDRGEFAAFMERPATQAREPRQGGPAFRELDSDDSGSIDQAEAEASDELAANWSRIDSDGDGAVSPSELSAFEVETESGPSAARPSEGEDEAASDATAVGDASPTDRADDVASTPRELSPQAQEQLARSRELVRQQQQAATVSRMSFDELDQDADGVIAQAEAVAPLARRWGQLDTDGNGNLTPAEFAAFEAGAPVDEGFPTREGPLYDRAYERPPYPDLEEGASPNGE